MNQNIGIVYSVAGAEKVIQSCEQIGRGLNNFLTQLGRVNRAMARFERTSDTFTTRLSSIRRSLGSFSGTKMRRGFDDTTSSVSRLNATLKRTERLARGVAVQLRRASAVPPMRGGGVAAAGVMPLGPGVGISRRAQSQWGLSPYGFMGRWWGAYMGAHAGARFARNTMLGGARESMVDPLRDLTNVSLNKQARAYTEKEGFKFLQKYYAGGGIEDYLSAAAEVGSALDVNKIGVRALNRLTRTSALLGMGTQMSGEEATKLLMGTVHAQLAQMPKARSEAYLSGKADIGALGEKTAGKLYKIIQVASIWGKDVQNALAYALPTALEKGWKIDDLLGIVGTMKTAGHKAPKIGRFLKAFVEGETGKHAKLAIADDPEKWARYKSLRGEARQEMLAKETTRMDQWLKRDPWGYFQRVGELAAAAEARGQNLVQQMGLSKQWVGQTRLLTKPSFIERARDQAQQVRGAEGLKELRRNLADVQTDSGYWSRRFGNTWKDIQSGMSAKSPIGGILDRNLAAMQMFADWNRGGKWNYADVLGTGKDFLLHGLIGGISQEAANAYSDVGKALGLLDKRAKPVNFEEQILRLNRIPDRIYGSVREMVNTSTRAAENAVTDALQTVKNAPYKLWGAIKRGAAGMLPQFLDASQVPYRPGRDLVWGNQGPVMPDNVVPIRPDVQNPPQPAVPPEPPSLSDQGANLSEAIMALVGALGSQNNAAPQVKVMIGDREIRDLVVETLADQGTENRAPWGSRMW